MIIFMTKKQSITFLLGLSIVDRCISLYSKSFRSTNVLLYIFRIINHSFPAYEPVPKLSSCKYSLQIVFLYGSEVLFNWFNCISVSSTIAFMPPSHWSYSLVLITVLSITSEGHLPLKTWLLQVSETQ